LTGHHNLVGVSGFERDKVKLTSNQSLFIDLLRGLSALAVMIGHSMSALAAPPAFEWYKIQNFAVVVFFARKDAYSFGEYFVDRFCRIFVAFIPALAFTLAVDIVSGSTGARHAPQVFAGNLLMLQGIPFEKIAPWAGLIKAYGTNSPLWTVAVEWWMYVAFGVVFFSTRLRGFGAVFAALLAVPAVMVIVLYSLRESLSTTWILAALLAAPIAMLTAKQAQRFAWAALALSLVLFAVKFSFLRTFQSFNAYDQHLMFMLAFVILSAIAALKSVGTPFLSRAAGPIKWISNISYSLYLVHYPLLVLFSVLFPQEFSIPVFLVYNLIGLFIAWLFTIAFDQHHAAVAVWIKRRLFVRGPSGEAVPIGE
jgi:peptidoglycan/LPS O-acetylase OafA/YrhL